MMKYLLGHPLGHLLGQALFFQEILPMMTYLLGHLLGRHRFQVVLLIMKNYLRLRLMDHEIEPLHRRMA